jgi:hypothetical protein
MIIRSAVVVPNSTSGGGGGGGGSVPPSAGAVGIGGLGGTTAGGDRSAAAQAASSSSSSSSSSGGLQPGKPVNSYEIKDIYPLAISSGPSDSGREVIIAGVVLKASPSTIGPGGNKIPGSPAGPVIRHIDIAAPLKDAIKADTNLGGHLSRSLASIIMGGQQAASGGGKILLAGVGASSGDRFKAVQSVMPDNVNAASSGGLGATGRRTSIALAAGSTVLGPQDSERDAGGALSVQGSQMLPSGAASVAGGAGAGTEAASTAGGPAGAGAGAAGGGATQQSSGPSQDSLGCLRAYRMPPAGDYVETVCHAGAITKMVITPNNKAVITVGSDGTIALLAVVDLKPKAGGPTAGPGQGVGAGGAEEGLPWAEEVLVMRSDLEEVRKERMDLEVSFITSHSLAVTRMPFAVAFSPLLFVLLLCFALFVAGPRPGNHNGQQVQRALQGHDQR